MKLALHSIGKLPIHGDFIRQDRGAPELAALDEWIQEGMYRSRERAGADTSAWDAAYDAETPASFVVVDERGGLLAGVCAPSRDTVGRRYPMTVAARFAYAPSGHEAFAAVPILFGPLFAAVERLLLDGWHGLELAQVKALLGAVDVPDLQAAAADGPIDAWLRTEKLDAVGADALAGALAGLEDALDAPQAPRFVVRLPVRSTTTVAFWLSQIERIGAHLGPAHRPNLVWWRLPGDPRAVGARTEVALHWGRPAGRAFDAVFWTEARGDDAYDAAGAAAADGASSPHLEAARAATARATDLAGLREALG